MRKTPRYGLTFFQYGDMYSSIKDHRTMQITDNQLINLSKIVGDGVISGWNMSCIGSGSPIIEVTPGHGFINNIYSKTISNKYTSLLDNAISYIYMQSKAYDPTLTEQGLQIEVEGPAGPLGIDPVTNTWKSVTYENLNPPNNPTGFKGQSVNFDVINLFWNPNTDSDLDYYEIQRSIDNFISDINIAGKPKTNGSYPDVPFVDYGLNGNTFYYYRIKAVDTAGNSSSWIYATQIDGITSQPIITPIDTTKPGEVSNVKIFAGNGHAVVIFDKSLSSNVTSYKITIQKVDLAGVVFDAQIILSENLEETREINGLTNFQRYRITIQSRNSVGNLSNGISVDTTPISSTTPEEISDLVAIPQTGGIELSWTASPSLNKYKYLISIYEPNNFEESFPIDVGLVTNKLITGYSKKTDVGSGPFQKLKTDVYYLVRVKVSDQFGNASIGKFVKEQIIDDVVPKDPNTIVAIPGDKTISVTWNKSPSKDVLYYLFAFRIEEGSWTEFSVGNSTSYILNSIPNDVEIETRVKAVDDAGLISSGVVSKKVICTKDTIPPDPPVGMKLLVGDEQIKIDWNSSSALDFSFFEIMRRRIIATDSTSSGGDLELDLTFDPKHPFPVQVFNVLDATEVLDLGLTNGKYYAYNVRAVDIYGNYGIWSETHIGKPDYGINFGRKYRRLREPANVNAEYYSPTETIKITWEYWYPSGKQDFFNETTYPPGGPANYPEDGPTSFNVYRSDKGALIGYELIASIKSDKWEFYDNIKLVKGKSYWYAVSAVRDVCDIVADTGSISPPNSILIGSVEISGGICKYLKNEKRIVDNLDATIRFETESRLLEHKHSSSPINVALVEATGILPLIDLYVMKEDCFNISPTGDDSFTCSSSLSQESIQLYLNMVLEGINIESKSVIIEEGGYNYDYFVKKYEFKQFYFQPRQAYTINPKYVTWNVPFIGDFQVIVNGQKPSVQFAIDKSLNIIIFYEQLPEDSIVSLNGIGYSYYVPVKINEDYTGHRILVNGIEKYDSMLDETLQTIRFKNAIDVSFTVNLEIEPILPDYGNQEEARKVNLSQDFILNDLKSLDGKLFQSESGLFEDGDAVFPIDSNGEKITGYTIDYKNKSVILDEAISPLDVIALQIKNKPEVEGILPSEKIIGIDGSSFKSGQLKKCQLPEISHNGRMNESALPKFVQFSSENNYVYYGNEKVSGNATTVYSIILFNNKIIMGTSSGLYRSKFGGILLSTSDKAVIDPLQLSYILTFSDDIINATNIASDTAGHLDGQIKIPDRSIAINNPSLCYMKNGEIFISGGIINNIVSDKCYIYDSTTKISRITSNMSVPRVGHCLIILDDGRLMAIGGMSNNNSCLSESIFDSFPSYPSNGIVGLYQLSSCEIFNPSVELWDQKANMSDPRSYMAAIMIDKENILVAGGYSLKNQNGFSRNGYIKDSPILDSNGNVIREGQYCDKTIYTINYQTSCQYSITSNLWSSAGNMDDGGKIYKCGFYKNTTPFVNFVNKRELYNISSKTWEYGKTGYSNVQNIEGIKIEEPIKQLFVDSEERILAIGRKKIYISYNEGETWAETTGLDSIGCVHCISESAKTLYAATDLGVYVITNRTRSSNAWVQGGLIGAGTTETFDLLPYEMFYPNGSGILAATEIGVFFSSDSAQTWVQTTPDYLENIRNIESFGPDKLFITSGNEIWQSNDRGHSWSKTGTYLFINDNSKLLSRYPLDMFIGTAHGLYYSKNMISYELVNFDLNRNDRMNSVQNLSMLGDDVCVGYDLSLFTIGPDLTCTKISEFTGIVPTVKVNKKEVRNGYRYNVKFGYIVFEFKLFSDDLVEIATDYTTYIMSGGPWYHQNPDAPFIVFINEKEISEDKYQKNSFDATITFKTLLTKFDKVSASISNIYINDSGSYFHSELEDKLEMEKGFPLSLGRDAVCNMLQIGVAMEHNFLERGIDRNQYYCLQHSWSDRSFNSFLANSNFIVFGRKDFDRFNSTIDYKIESSQSNIGYSAIMCLSSILYNNDLLFIGTDSDLFELNGIPGSITTPILLRVDPPDKFVPPVRFLAKYDDDVWLVSKSGIYKLSIINKKVSSWKKNQGINLPNTIYAFGMIGDVYIAATDEGMYYSDNTADPPFEQWTRGIHTDIKLRVELPLLGPASAIDIKDGIAYAGIGNEIYKSNDGKIWIRTYQFPKDDSQVTIFDPNKITNADRYDSASIAINKIVIFEDKVFVGTKNGLYTDNGTSKSNEVVFIQEKINGDTENSIPVNDIFYFVPNSSKSEIFLVGESKYLYNYKAGMDLNTPLTAQVIRDGENTTWIKNTVGNLTSMDKVIVTPSRTIIIFSGKSIYFG